MGNVNIKVLDDVKYQQKKIIILLYNDLELNTMDYNDALENDKRTNMLIYLSFIRTKHPFIFSFFPNKDYNISIIKINLFFLSFSIYFAINTFFFDYTIIHQIYEDKGNYSISYFSPQIIYSFLIAYFFSVIIKFFVLSERNLLELKHEKTLKKAKGKVEKIKQLLIIKNTCYFFIVLLFLFFFWYYLSYFCAVYQNSQIILIKNTLLSFSISLIYPFIINIIPVIVRRFSLSAKNRECIYKANIYIQYI